MKFLERDELANFTFQVQTERGLLREAGGCGRGTGS
jgi:hypothetical protein